MWVFYLLWMIFQCSAVCQRRIVPIQLHFFVTLILSKVICYSWTSLCVSGSVPSAHWSELLPHSDLWFSTDNPSVHRHVRCLSVWRTSLIRLGEGFCDKHATSHQRLTPHRRFKEIWETTRVSHLSVLFGLQPGGGGVCLRLNVFEQDCSYVWQSFCVPAHHFLVPVDASSKFIHNRPHPVTERSQENIFSLPVKIFFNKTASTYLLAHWTFAKYFRWHVNASRNVLSKHRCSRLRSHWTVWCLLFVFCKV